MRALRGFHRAVLVHEIFPSTMMDMDLIDFFY